MNNIKKWKWKFLNVPHKYVVNRRSSIVAGSLKTFAAASEGVRREAFCGSKVFCVG